MLNNNSRVYYNRSDRTDTAAHKDQNKTSTHSEWGVIRTDCDNTAADYQAKHLFLNERRCVYLAKPPP